MPESKKHATTVVEVPAETENTSVEVVVQVSVCLLRVKIVQSSKLAVAHGVVLGGGNGGFKKDEPCHVFLRTHLDVTCLEKYLQDQDTHPSSSSSSSSSSSHGTLTTGPWCNLSGHICCLRTVLTRAIERNRRGVKLIECQEIISLHRGNSDSDNDSNTHLHESSGICISSSLNKNDLYRFRMHDKSERHALFAQWLVDNYGRDFLARGSGVLDVAGGKGELSYALRDLGIPSMVLDPAPRLLLMGPHNISVLPFALEGDGTHLLEKEHTTTTFQDRALIRSCSMIVGMHPDQATEPIIRLAMHLGVPFALLPCCVMPSLFPLRFHQGQPVRSYRVFCQYLQALAEHEINKAEGCIRTDHLPFMGRNLILYSTVHYSSNQPF
jgi:hypothetical protein